MHLTAFHGACFLCQAVAFDSTTLDFDVCILFSAPLVAAAAPGSSAAVLCAQLPAIAAAWRQRVRWHREQRSDDRMKTARANFF